MKKVLITAVIVGVAAAVAIYYVSADSSTVFRRRSAGGSMDDMEDAADNAYNEMNRHVGKVERKTEDIIDKAFA